MNLLIRHKLSRRCRKQIHEYKEGRYKLGDWEKSVLISSLMVKWQKKKSKMQSNLQPNKNAMSRNKFAQ